MHQLRYLLGVVPFSVTSLSKEPEACYYEDNGLPCSGYSKNERRAATMDRSRYRSHRIITVLAVSGALVTAGCSTSHPTAIATKVTAPGMTAARAANLTSVTQGAAQPTPLYPWPESVAFANSRVGYLLLALQPHDGGPPNKPELLKTRDGGQTWATVKTEVDLNKLNDLQFFSANSGYAIEATPSSSTPDARIVRTTDGGAHWTTVPFVQGKFPANLSVVNHDLIFCTSTGGIYRTTNGGDSWVPIPPPSADTEVAGMSWISASVGYILDYPQPGAGEITLYRTVDGGRNWTVRARSTLTGGGRLEGVPVFKFFAGGIGFQDGSRGGILKTNDGGKTFFGISPYTDPPQMPDFLSPTEGYALRVQAHAVPLLVHTTDGGKHWTQVWPELWPRGPISFSSAKKGLAANLPLDPGEILETVDGGRTWAKIGQVPDSVFRLVRQSPGVVWALVDNDFTNPVQAYRSVDGWRTWRRQESFPPTGRTLSFANPRVGYVDDNQGGLYRTINGGTTWARIPQTKNTWFATFSTENQGWALLSGRVPVLVSTSDGARTWQQLGGNLNFRLLEGLWHLGRRDLFITGRSEEGDDGRFELFRSADGGRHLTEILYPPGILDLGDTQLDVVTSRVMFAISGEDGVIYRSLDGGKSFSVVTNLNGWSSP